MVRIENKLLYGVRMTSSKCPAGFVFEHTTKRFRQDQDATRGPP